MKKLEKEFFFWGGGYRVRHGCHSSGGGYENLRGANPVGG